MRHANLFRAQRCPHGLEPRQCSECCDARIAALEAALDRANEVCRQTQEIADLRGQEITQLRGQLQMLFKSAAATPVVSRETSTGDEHAALFSAIAKHKETT